MDQNTQILELIQRLYRKDFISVRELNELENWLIQLNSDQNFELWLQQNWLASTDLPVEISFEKIQLLLRRTIQKPVIYTFILNKFQRIAAILVIPILLISAFLFYQVLKTPENWVSLKTAKGERTHVILPDGSEAWLNVDSELKYSTNYNLANRTLKLFGEAFFKVAKDQKHPFLVQAGSFQVKAVGTEFGVYAYKNESRAETFLKEGIVDVNFLDGKGEKVRLNPGQKSKVDNNSHKIFVENTTIESDAAWTEGQLVFQNEDIPVVFHKIERWFNVSIQYNPSDFSKETLYVKLKRGETMEGTLRIIDDAIGINFKQTGNEIIIAKK